jgi:MYXO-CTERM domain-containing protein
MVSCAALSAAPATFAGVTWIDSYAGFDSYANLFAGTSTTSWSGSSALQAQTVANSSATTWVNAATSSGFTAGFANGSGGMKLEITRYFSLSEAAEVSVTMNMSSDQGSLTWMLLDFGTYNVYGTEVTNPNSGSSYALSSGSISLGSGTYAIILNMRDYFGMSVPPPTGTSGSISFSVPGPGAIAMVGLAGFLGRRRRG